MKLQFKKNMMRSPRQGWHYIDDSYTITGDSIDDVEKKIVAYRIRNGRPPGNPRHDMIHFWYNLSPDFLEEAVGDEPVNVSQSNALGGVLAWVKQLTQQVHDIENVKSLVTERSDVCLKCPHNVQIDADKAVLGEVNRRSFILCKGNQVKGLHFCKHHNVDLRVAVRVRNDFIKQAPGQPESCWVTS